MTKTMDFDEHPNEELPSKTQRKKDTHELQQLGLQLTEFSQSQLAELPISDKLRSAIKEFKRLPNSHGARRRQLQYIGKLMRDYQLDEISLEVEKAQQLPKKDTKATEIVTEICQRILQDGDSAINEILHEHQHLERQALRNFLLDYRKAVQSEKKPTAQKIEEKLFKYLVNSIK